jgi:hypothetical protein
MLDSPSLLPLEPENLLFKTCNLLELKGNWQLDVPCNKDALYYIHVAEMKQP